MTMLWCVWNRSDADLTQTNIKDGVDVFWVEGDLEFGVLWQDNIIIVNPDKKPEIDDPIVDSTSTPIDKVLCSDEDATNMYFVSIASYYNGNQQLRHCHVIFTTVNKSTQAITYVYDFPWWIWWDGVPTTKSDATKIYIKSPATSSSYYPNWWLLTITKATWAMTVNPNTTNDPWIVIWNSVSYNGNTLSADVAWMLFENTSWSQHAKSISINWFIKQT